MNMKTEIEIVMKQETVNNVPREPKWEIHVNNVRQFQFLHSLSKKDMLELREKLNSILIPLTS